MEASVTASELRSILADAFEGAAARLRSHSKQTREPDYPNANPDASKRLPNPTMLGGRLALSIGEAAECLGISRSSMYNDAFRGISGSPVRSPHAHPSCRLGAVD